ncbi:MAG: hypothetical protein ACRDYX_17615 [Egibacteraceae bacterium]
MDSDEYAALVASLYKPLSPEEQAAKWAAGVELVRACPFPLYGLGESWTGWRRLADYPETTRNRTDPKVLSVAFWHETDPWERPAPEVLIEICEEPDRFSRRFHVGWLAVEITAWEREWERGEEEERGEVIERRTADLLANGVWRPVALPVDGSPQTFDLLDGGLVWVANANIDGNTVVVSGRGVDVGEVDLVTADLEPYIEGDRRFRFAPRHP